MTQKFEVKSCGKIYIAGEYAVVNGGKAIIAPIKKYIRIIYEESNTYKLKSHKYHDDFIDLDLSTDVIELKPIIKTINIMNQYLLETGIIDKKLKLEIFSELDNENNKKFGFGSSSSIIIAIIRVYNQFYNLGLSNLQIYKLAVIIQLSISKYSSFGDIACIVYEKVIYYQKFNDIINLSDSLIVNINKDWNGLVIEPLNIDFDFLLVYTNEEANSFELVRRVNELINEPFYNAFFRRSEILVNQIKEKSKSLIDLINNLNTNLKILDFGLYGALMTKNMYLIEEIVNKFEGGFKFTGSGGGDCVICIFPNEEKRSLGKEKLKELGYEVIDYIWRE